MAAAKNWSDDLAAAPKDRELLLGWHGSDGAFHANVGVWNEDCGFWVDAVTHDLVLHADSLEFWAEINAPIYITIREAD